MSTQEIVQDFTSAQELSLSQDFADAQTKDEVTTGLGRRIMAGVAGIAAAAGTLVAGGAPEAASASGHEPVGSSYHPVRPERVEDTRMKGEHKLIGGEWRAIQVAGDYGIPEDATAIVATVTATDTSGPGFVSVVPTGPEATGVPTVSSLNPERAGQSLANTLTIPLGENGQVSVFSDKDTHLIFDVSGYFGEEKNPAQVSGGRFRAIPDARVLDTRQDHVALDGSTRVIDLSAHCKDAVAAVVTLTAAEASGPGYLVAWDGVGPMPATSDLNFDQHGPRANTTYVPLNANEEFSLHTVVAPATDKDTGHTEEIVDVKACFSANGAPIPMNVMDGLFVPVWNQRLLDTRTDGGKVAAGQNRWVEIANLPSELQDQGVQGATVNVTINEAEGSGFVTADNRGDNERTSAGNAVDGQTVANATIISTAETAAGKSGFFLRNGGESRYKSHLLADITGVYLGGESTPVDPGTEPQPGVTRVGYGGTYNPVAENDLRFDCEYSPNGAGGYNVDFDVLVSGLVTDTNPDNGVNEGEHLEVLTSKYQNGPGAPIYADTITNLYADSPTEASSGSYVVPNEAEANLFKGKVIVTRSFEHKPTSSHTTFEIDVDCDPV